MISEGPVLEALTRRLAETPPEFLVEPRIGRQGVVNVAAVVNDTLITLGSAPLTPDAASLFRPTNAKEDRNFLQTVLIGCWLLYAEWFRMNPPTGERALNFLWENLSDLSAVTSAHKFTTDADRREEMARVALNVFGLRPLGESETQAQDRLMTLNAAERERVIVAARAAEKRAQEVREAMARQAAEEAAAKAYRE